MEDLSKFISPILNPKHQWPILKTWLYKLKIKNFVLPLIVYFIIMLQSPALDVLALSSAIVSTYHTTAELWAKTSMAEIQSMTIYLFNNAKVGLGISWLHIETKKK